MSSQIDQVDGRGAFPFCSVLATVKAPKLMGAVIRSLAVWCLTLSLVGGIWLPAESSGLADADGICGPVLAVGNAASRFVPDHGQTPQTEHCLFCHWRQTMASASAAAFVAIASPVDAGRAPATVASFDLVLVDIGSTASRGPPAIS